jgi:transposase-like protein
MENLNLVQIIAEYGDNDKARELLESLRWPNGPICPHCKAAEAYKLRPKPTSKRPGREGLYKCKSCRKQFTVTVGTIFEDSHIPLGKWLVAIYLMCASKKGVSAHQLHRMLKVQYKSAWFMAHRIRHAITAEPLATMLSGVVEADETYIGVRRRGAGPGRPGPGDPKKTPVVALIERGGPARAKVIASVTAPNLREHIEANVDPQAMLMTDELRAYKRIGRQFKRHGVIRHKDGVYVKGDVTTNAAEGFFSLLKRGINGTFHHVSPVHLHRYVAEFEHRYNERKVSDGGRIAKTIEMTAGKRLMYKEPITRPTSALSRRPLSQAR